MVAQSNGTSAVRTYLLHVPATFPSHSGALVVSLHGTGASGHVQESNTQMDVTADQGGFAVAYPDALPAPGEGNMNEWNLYFEGTHWPGSTAPDDVAFLRQLITMLQASLQADSKRIYVVGFSAGAFMALRAGVELSDVVAAVGAVSGTLYGQPPDFTGTVPAPAGAASILMLHADQDDRVHYCGGTSSFGNLNSASQETAFNYWVAANVCTKVNTTAPLCDGGGNITGVTEKRATGCRSNTEVSLYRLTGAGHFTAYNNIDLSAYNPSLSATTGTLTNDIVWKFLATHPRQ